MNYSIEKVHAKGLPWFKCWFDSVYYHKLYNNRDEKEAADFIDKLVACLKPASNSAMLDVGCGTGRHSKYLASKGYNVTGLDLAFNSIRQAKKYESESLRFYQHDMRHLFGIKNFNFVFSFFTSFGYFKSEKENEKVISNMSKSLQPGGTLMIDYINPDFAQAKLIPNEKKDIDGVIYHITRWTNEKGFFKKIEIENGQTGDKFKYTEQVAKWKLNDFKAALELNNLKSYLVYGDYLLNEYDPNDSPRLIIIARKQNNLPG